MERQSYWERAYYYGNAGLDIVRTPEARRRWFLENMRRTGAEAYFANARCARAGQRTETRERLFQLEVWRWNDDVVSDLRGPLQIAWMLGFTAARRLTEAL